MKSNGEIMKRYRFFHGKCLIGSSELGGADASMGIRAGQYFPEAGYGEIEALIREYSQTSFDAQYALHLRTQEGELRDKVNALDLHVETQDGCLIKTSFIDLVDHYADLGEEGREVHICVESWDVYEQFFDDH